MLRILAAIFAIGVAVFSVSLVDKLVMNAPAMRALAGER